MRKSSSITAIENSTAIVMLTREEERIIANRYQIALVNALDFRWILYIFCLSSGNLSMACSL